jgi:uncharacterized protein (DUF1501 family)
MMDRRQILSGIGLGGLGLAGAITGASRFAFAADPTDKRLVVVLLRGAMDGLSAAPAYGDPDFERARNGLAIAKPGQPDGALALDGFFGLHPSLSGLHARYAKRELIVFHAIASPYRDRSHFDGQNLIENGSDAPYGLPDGWLNRALIGLPEARRQGRTDLGVALAPSMPLMMRGPARVTSWSPSLLPAPQGDLIARIRAMYDQTDPKLAMALAEAVDANATTGGGDRKTGGQEFAVLMKAAAKFMAEPNGPCVAMIESTGWDTHAGQAGAYSPLTRNLVTLDGGIQALADGLGDRWSTTAVVVVTEFGRMVAMNGTGGTDHGTAGAAFLVGGAVAGGRVMADWPGLKTANLYAGRDLKPTADLRSLTKAALRDHLGMDEARLETAVFPGSASAKPFEGLFRS